MMEAMKRTMRSAALIFFARPSLILSCVLLPILNSIAIAVPITQQWPMGGQNLGNTRNQPFESAIGPSNVNQLVVKWVFTTGGHVSVTPAVVNGIVYFPDQS